MKKLLLILSLILTTFVTKASHIMGGMIAVAQTSQDSTSVGMYLISDSQGVPLPQSVSIEKWSMNSVGWYMLDGYITLDKVTSTTHQGQNLTNYVSDYLDLDSNKYRFIYKNCCWGMLDNSTNSTTAEFIISTDYWHIPNNSTPYAENPIWINMQKDSVNTMKPVWGNYNCFLTNPDYGDTVNLIQTELHSGYANGVFVPQIGQSPSNMYVGNDSITFVSSNLGRVGNGFEIADYRNGDKIGIQRIQWTFIVVNSTLGIEELTTENMEYEIYDWMGRYKGKDILSLQEGLYIIRYKNGKTEKVYRL
jgi:hypothetical protein